MPPASDSGDAQDATSAECAGQGDHVVEPGTCLISLSEHHGFFWQTLWEHPENRDLRSKRRDPWVLLPGDRVAIPEKRLKQETASTDKKHTFVRKGIPAKLRLEFHEDDRPLSDLPYLVAIDDATFQRGTTDGQGRIEISLPKQARAGTVRIGDGESERVYELKLGALDPEDSVSGVQGRLNNLGFKVGAVDGRLGSKTADAIRRFQAYHSLPVTGVPDRATCQKLKERHGA